MATPEILFRVFLFYFEKISGHFGLFRDILVNTGRNSKFGLKKKNFLKPKQICIMYTEKPQKEKKMKRKEINKGTFTIN